ncbi:MAG: endonuclease/exonuclease/phosphatase family protein [Pseudomonadota bacterium]
MVLPILVVFAGLMTPAAALDRVTIVSFNVGNLFDAEDDPDNFGDDTYLPLSLKEARPEHNSNCDANISIPFFADQCKQLDWSEEVLAAKLENIADVILSMPERPDILVLQETENAEIVARLNDEFLGEHRFAELIHLDSTDEVLDRGIDVAILTDLALIGEAEALRVDFGDNQEECRATRDVAVADLALPDGAPLRVYGVHFPSGSNPLICRQIAMTTVRDAQSGEGSPELAVMAGDINFPCYETESEFFARLLRDGEWWSPPEILSGCGQPGTKKFRQRGFSQNWFTWSFLDAVFVSNALVDRRTEANWFADLGSFRTVISSDHQLEVDAGGFIEPRRFDPVALTGVSDHLPVALDLVPRGTR